MSPFDLERLQRDTFVRRIEYLNETTSTNTVALALTEDEIGPLPLLVLAARQTDGRGRGANRWWSSEGALTFSIVLDAGAVRLSPPRRPLMSLATGLAVAEAIADLFPRGEVGVKWPNDVYLGGKKVAGILVESARRGEQLVVGVGINVNNSLSDAPAGIAGRATSMVDVAGEMLNLTTVLTCVLQHFSRQLEALADDEERIIESLRQRCVLTGRRVLVDAGQECVAGVCRGLDGDGALLIATSSGLRRVVAGVVAAIE